MYKYEYPHPAVTTDCVIFGFDEIEQKVKVLLIQRDNEPQRGYWAFPGGFLKMDETVEECANRELEEETSLKVEYMDQLPVFSGVDRDPRERVVTIPFYALVKPTQVEGGDDAAKASWFSLDSVPPLAFDHDQILKVALNRLKEQIHFKPIGFDLLPETFTMTQLQNLYEAILDVKFDRRNFYKKMNAIGLVQKVATSQQGVDGCTEKNESESSDSLNSHSGSRATVYYRFNPERYDELKAKGFKLEF